MHLKLPYYFCLALLLSTLITCKKEPTNSETGSENTPVASIVITAPSQDLKEGDTLHLTAAAKDASGKVLPDKQIAWSTSDPAVASVDKGLVIGIKAGKSKITASSEGIVSHLNITVQEKDTLTKNIGMDGGQLSSEGIGSVLFDPGTLSQKTLVTFSKNSSEEIKKDKEVAAAWFGVSKWSDHELRINTANHQPTKMVTVQVKLTDDLISKIPSGSGAGAYAKLFLDNDGERTENFEPIQSDFYGSRKVLQIKLIPEFFSNVWTSDGTFEAIISVGITPGENPSIGGIMPGSSNTILGTQSPEDETPPTSACLGLITCPTDDCSNISRGYTPVPKPHVTSPQPRAHLGTDLRGAIGDPVYAAADGQIIYQGFQENHTNKTGWGNFIIIRHTTPLGVFRTLYAHLDKKIKTNGKVKRGDKIGEVGNTGYVSGPHLHFEYVLEGGEANLPSKSEPRIDPMACKDSIDIYKASAIGKYKVVDPTPHVQDVYCELRSDGKAIYTVYNSTSWPDGKSWDTNWTIVYKEDGRYYYVETGGGSWFSYIVPNARPLEYPVKNMYFAYDHPADPNSRLTVYERQ